MKSQMKDLHNELSATKRQLDTVQKNLQSEKAKRRKMEKQISKEDRGPVEGASQTNADLIDLANLPVVTKKKTTRVTFPSSTLDNNQSNQQHLS